MRILKIQFIGIDNLDEDEAEVIDCGLVAMGGPATPKNLKYEGVAQDGSDVYSYGSKTTDSQINKSMKKIQKDLPDVIWAIYDKEGDIKWTSKGLVV